MTRFPPFLLAMLFCGSVQSGVALAQPRPPANPAPALRDGSHDFDFEFGSWKAHIARRLKPLTGSTE